MLKKTLIPAAILLAAPTFAQQFMGLSTNQYSAVQQMPYNPAWVNNAANGREVHLFSGGVAFGTNAYRFSKDFLTGGNTSGGVEGTDYFKDVRGNKKYVWGNIELMGPAASFALKNNQHVGFYTRMRQIARGGNLTNDAFRLLGDMGGEYPLSVQIEQAGYSVHSFGEIGLSYGKVLSNDFYHVLKAGVSVKYLIGLAAGSIYINSAELVKSTPDSLNTLEGDATILYSDNVKLIDNNFNFDIGGMFNRGGGGSLGFDIGFQYEYHPDGDPNRETPYLFSIAASITDIGSITYRADTGSGEYDLTMSKRAMWQFDKNIYESDVEYLGRMERDSMLTRTSEPDAFPMGLPTALRINTDWNVSENFWVQANVVLNLKGDNGNVYRPAYVNMLNITPRYEKGLLMFGVPFTYWGYQTFTLGAVFRAGPLYVGSTSLFSTLMNKQGRSLDAYAGLVFKLKNNRNYYTY